jgi:heterodisulfide reductase subunit C
MPYPQIALSAEKNMIGKHLDRVRKMVAACIQCGTCTGSCPNEFAMDLTPRHLWRLVLMGQKEAIFASQTFALCSACYYCTLRCPRGLPLTEAMEALKQIAAACYPKDYKNSVAFYQSFMKSVRKYGRVHEIGFINQYYFAMGNPLLPMRYASLGLKLISKGKLSFQAPQPGKGKRDLEAIFRKVETMEANP